MRIAFLPKCMADEECLEKKHDNQFFYLAVLSTETLQCIFLDFCKKNYFINY